MGLEKRKLQIKEKQKEIEEHLKESNYEKNKNNN